MRRAHKANPDLLPARELLLQLLTVNNQMAEAYDLLRAQDLPVFLVGFVVSFVSALVVVKAFLSFVSRHTFVPFAWYRIVFGGLLLAFWGLRG